MENLPIHVNPEDVSRLGEFAIKAFGGSKGVIDVCKKVFGEQVTMLLFTKKAKQEAERARLLGEVEMQKSLQSKAVDGFAQTEEGKHIMNAIGASILYQQLNRIGNLGSIMETAAEQLEQEKVLVSDESVDEDWMNRFLNHAGEVSNEEMQKLWGRVLAGEVKRPSSYSLRTLEFLKNISKEEAELITKVSGCAMTVYNSTFLIGKKSDFNETKHGIRYSDLLKLSELGVIQLEDVLMSIPATSSNKQIGITLFQGKRLFYFRMMTSKEDNKDNLFQIQLSGIIFTALGHQLCGLVTPKIDVNLLREVQSSLIAATGALNADCLVSDEYTSENDNKTYTNLKPVYLFDSPENTDSQK